MATPAVYPKKIFKPNEFTFPRFIPVQFNKYSNSQYQNHFKKIKNFSDPDFPYYFKAKIYPDIAFHSMFEVMENEGTIDSFIGFYLNALPDILTYTPIDAIQTICNLNLIKESKEYLTSLKLSLLYCRLTDDCSKVCLTCLLKNSHRFIKDSQSHIVASFLLKILIILSNITEDKQNSSKIKNSNYEHIKALDQCLAEQINIFFSLIMKHHVNVFSLGTISHVLQEFLTELDVSAPSPSSIIKYPKRCSVNSVFSVSLVLGEVNSSLIDFSKTKNKHLKKIFLLSPIQTRDCVIFLKQLNPKIDTSRQTICNIVSYNNPLKIDKNIEKQIVMNTNVIVAILSRFIKKIDIRINDERSLFELSQVLNSIAENGELFEERVQYLVISLVSKLIVRFPLNLNTLEVDKFLFLSSSLSSSVRLLYDFFWFSSSIKVPILHYMDILLISPFLLMPNPLTFPVEVIESHLKIIEMIILDDYINWFEFVLKQPPMYSNLQVISIIIKNHWKEETLFLMVSKNITDIIKQSFEIIKSFSFKVINVVPKLWIEIITFFTQFNIDESIHFAYITLRMLFDNLMSFKFSDEEGFCYIMMIVEQLIVTPMYHYTLCTYDSMILGLLFEMDETHLKPGAFLSLLRLISAVFEKNCANYEVNALFGMPSYITIFKIGMMCIQYLNAPDYEETEIVAAKIIANLIDNKYSQGIIGNILKKAPEKYSFASVEENQLRQTVLELQSKINSIVPNKIRKIELGYIMWRNDFKNGTSFETLIQYAKDNFFYE